MKKEYLLLEIFCICFHSFALDKECPKNHLLCDEGQCISPAKICDDIPHCDDISDERGCDCKQFGGFTCLNSRECYYSNEICDGTKDCLDGTDEFNCTVQRSATTPPEAQIIIIPSLSKQKSIYLPTHPCSDSKITFLESVPSEIKTTTAAPISQKILTHNQIKSTTPKTGKVLKEDIFPFDACQGAPYIPESVSKGDAKCLECFCMNTNSSCHFSPFMKRLQIEPITTLCSEKIRKRKRKKYNRVKLRRKKKKGRKHIFKRVTSDLSKAYPSYKRNLITAYGGRMIIVADNIYPLSTVAVFLKGNGLTLRRKKRRVTCPKIEISLLEKGWKIQISKGSYKKATREHLLIALSDLKAIKVKALLLSREYGLVIRQFVVTTASEKFSFGRHATEVEVCNCPPGHIGHSCETCADGYDAQITSTTEKYSIKCIAKAPPTVFSLPWKTLNIASASKSPGRIKYIIEFNKTNDQVYRIALEPYKRLEYKFISVNKARKHYKTHKYNVLEIPNFKFPKPFN